MKRALAVLGTCFLIVAGGVACAVLVVWIYSTFLAPGRPLSEYQAFAQASAPIVSVIAGPVVTFLGVRLLVRNSEYREAVILAAAVMVLYAVFDIIVLALANPSLGIWGLAFLSLLLRTLAAWGATIYRPQGKEAQPKTTDLTNPR